MIVASLGLALAADHVVGDGYASVQAAVDAASPGDTVVLGEGVWPGPVTVDKALTLRSDGGLLVGDAGTTLRIAVPGVLVDQLRVQGSGDDLQGPDACIYVEPEATGTVITDSQLSDCLFGIWVHEADGTRIEGNHIVGRPGERPASKGNGVHLFDASELTIRGNTVEGARDGIYVSACEDSVIAENVVSHQRYGIHFMYSYDNVIRDNVANHNSGGIALMQSRNLEVVGNTATDNDRHGILFRDAQYSTIAHNHVANNAEGLFFFSSLDNTIEGNLIAGNQIGARVWAGTERNVVRDNRFVGNRQQVYYVASADQHWDANYWSDYLGWDQDGDGYGDRPYETDALLARLLHSYPSAVLLLNSPALELLLQLQSRVPALDVPAVVDEAPHIAPPGEDS